MRTVVKDEANVQAAVKQSLLRSTGASGVRAEAEFDNDITVNPLRSCCDFDESKHGNGHNNNTGIEYFQHPTEAESKSPQIVHQGRVYNGL